MQALSQLFDETTLMVPVTTAGAAAGEIPLPGHPLTVVPLPPRKGSGVASKLSFIPWLLANLPAVVREFRAADAVHAPIPGDVGTVGMIMAWCTGKPLFVRHCGNWTRPVTRAEKFWRWFMERTAGGRNVMLATGGMPEAPSARNPHVRWIFSSSLTSAELESCGAPRSLGDQVRLIIVARQEVAKGAGLIIRGLPMLSSRFPGIQLDVVGDGPAMSGLRRLADESGVADRVRFTGKVDHDQVMALLTQATLFVFPTTSSEGFPKAVLEALAAGVPVIATRVSVLPHLLSSGGGILIEDATPGAVVRAVEGALADRAAYEVMSRRAMASAREFSLEAWRDTIGGCLESAWGPLKSAGA